MKKKEKPRMEEPREKNTGEGQLLETTSRGGSKKGTRVEYAVNGPALTHWLKKKGCRRTGSISIREEKQIWKRQARTALDSDAPARETVQRKRP